MRARRRQESGQLLVPMCGLLIVFGLLLVGYVHWCRALYRRMRIEMIADVTALSAARAQAEMLNRIATANTMVNTYLQEFRFPYTGYYVGTISVDKYRKLVDDMKTLRDKVNGFRSYPPSVGRVVAQANGASPLSPYFPPRMDSYLVPQTVYLMIRMPYPLPPVFRAAEGAFYARSWKPNFVKAQPSHHTSWIVERNGFRAMSTARLWLDVPNSDFFHNGGFPRVRESVWHSVGIQCFYPQFNARLTRVAKSWRFNDGG
jgi:hypothetical protein